MTKEIILLAAAIALGGCITIGKPFQQVITSSIQIGKTTQSDIQKTYGDPQMQGIDDGNPAWTYLYVKAGVFNPARAEHMTVKFNADGTVRSYNFSSNL